MPNILGSNDKRGKQGLEKLLAFKRANSDNTFMASRACDDKEEKRKRMIELAKKAASESALSKQTQWLNRRISHPTEKNEIAVQPMLALQKPVSHITGTRPELVRRNTVSFGNSYACANLELNTAAAARTEETYRGKSSSHRLKKPEVSAEEDELLVDKTSSAKGDGISLGRDQVGGECGLEGLTYAVLKAPRHGLNARALIMRATEALASQSAQGESQVMPGVKANDVPLSADDHVACKARGDNRLRKSTLDAAALCAQVHIRSRPLVQYVPNSVIPRLARQNCADRLFGQYLELLLHDLGVFDAEEATKVLPTEEVIVRGACTTALAHEYSVYMSVTTKLAYMAAAAPVQALHSRIPANIVRSVHALAQSRNGPVASEPDLDLEEGPSSKRQKVVGEMYGGHREVQNGDDLDHLFDSDRESGESDVEEQAHASQQFECGPDYETAIDHLFGSDEDDVECVAKADKTDTRSEGDPHISTSDQLSHLPLEILDQIMSPQTAALSGDYMSHGKIAVDDLMQITHMMHVDDSEKTLADAIATLPRHVLQNAIAMCAESIAAKFGQAVTAPQQSTSSSVPAPFQNLTPFPLSSAPLQNPGTSNGETLREIEGLPSCAMGCGSSEIFSVSCAPLSEPGTSNADPPGVNENVPSSTIGPGAAELLHMSCSPLSEPGTSNADPQGVNVNVPSTTIQLGTAEIFPMSCALISQPGASSVETPASTLNSSPGDEGSMPTNASPFPLPLAVELRVPTDSSSSPLPSAVEGYRPTESSPESLPPAAEGCRRTDLSPQLLHLAAEGCRPTDSSPRPPHSATEGCRPTDSSPQPPPSAAEGCSTIDSFPQPPSLAAQGCDPSDLSPVPQMPATQGCDPTNSSLLSLPSAAVGCQPADPSSRSSSSAVEKCMTIESSPRPPLSAIEGCAPTDISPQPLSAIESCAPTDISPQPPPSSQGLLWQIKPTRSLMDLCAEPLPLSARSSSYTAEDLDEYTVHGESEARDRVWSAHETSGSSRREQSVKSARASATSVPESSDRLHRGGSRLPLDLRNSAGRMSVTSMMENMITACRSRSLEPRDEKCSDASRASYGTEIPNPPPRLHTRDACSAKVRDFLNEFSRNTGQASTSSTQDAPAARQSRLLSIASRLRDGVGAWIAAPDNAADIASTLPARESQLPDMRTQHTEHEPSRIIHNEPVHRGSKDGKVQNSERAKMDRGGSADADEHAAGGQAGNRGASTSRETQRQARTGRQEQTWVERQEPGVRQRRSDGEQPGSVPKHPLTAHVTGFVKGVLTPLYQAQLLTKEGYSTVAAESVEKILSRHHNETSPDFLFRYHDTIQKFVLRSAERQRSKEVTPYSTA